MANLKTKYPQYAEYKDSGVEWLETIPKDWGVTRLKFVASIVGRIGFRGYTVDDIVDVGEGAIVLSPSNVNGDSFCLEKKAYLSWAKYFESPEIMVQENDILLVKTGSTFGKSTIVRKVREPMTINPQMTLIKKSSIDARFLSYLFNSSLIKAKIEVSNTGSGMPTMTQENINNFPVPLPDKKSDIKIANFLDHETAQIDTLIEKQQTLIQLLKEKRQAVISHAVTKGLNPDVPMKDSGVEWLGEVPAHWGITKLKWKASTTSGGTPTTSKYEDYYEDGDIPWIRTTDLNNDKLNETPIMITPKAVRDSACSLLPKNSVLIAMYGGAGSIGKHSLLNFESTINQAVCGVLPSEAFVPDYLHRFYEFYRPFWMIGAAGTRKDPNIGQDNIKEAKMLIPPSNEQSQIADYLDKMQSYFDALTESAEKGIQLMQERRTALISAAVTGKIDVRGWVAPE